MDEGLWAGVIFNNKQTNKNNQYGMSTINWKRHWSRGGTGFWKPPDELAINISATEPRGGQRSPREVGRAVKEHFGGLRDATIHQLVQDFTI